MTALVGVSVGNVSVKPFSGPSYVEVSAFADCSPAVEKRPEFIFIRQLRPEPIAELVGSDPSTFPTVDEVRCYVALRHGDDVTILTVGQFDWLREFRSQWWIKLNETPIRKSLLEAGSSGTPESFVILPSFSSAPTTMIPP